jgi:hypothetical protein
VVLYADAFIFGTERFNEKTKIRFKFIANGDIAIFPRRRILFENLHHTGHSFGKMVLFCLGKLRDIRWYLSFPEWGNCADRYKN